MSKINILHIVTKLELGGAQKNVLSILEGLDKEKYNPFLISGRKGILVKNALSLKGVEINLISTLHRRINILCDFLAIYAIYRYIKKKKISIVHTHSSKAGILGRWAAKLAGVPVIIHTIHGWEFHQQQDFFSHHLFVSLESITAKITTKMVAVSRYDIRAGLEKRICSEDKYFLIRYGIKKGDFFNLRIDIKSKKAELNLEPDSLVVGMVACFKAQKSPLDFIKVAHLVTKILPRVKFLLVGDGILYAKITNLIKKYSLENNILLSGWRRDIPEIMAVLDVFVLTSRWEGLPIVCLEAMASSKSVVVTAVGGASEIIREGENGFLAPAGDVEKMSARVIQLLMDEGLRQRMGQRGRALLDPAFEQSFMLNRINHLYDNLRKENLLS